MVVEQIDNRMDNTELRKEMSEKPATRNSS